MKIDVCGIPFTVSIVDKPFKSGPQYFGECDGKAAAIGIHKDCSPEQSDATLVHEWIHGVLMCNGHDDNESIVSIIATELYRVGFRVKVIDSDKKSK